MTLHLERIEWMPSPPLVPEDGPIDFEHLQRMTLGDDGLEQEVLAMFAAQAAQLVVSLAAMPADAASAGAYAEGLRPRDRRLCRGGCRRRLEAALGRGCRSGGAAGSLNWAMRYQLAQAAIEAILRRS